MTVGMPLRELLIQLIYLVSSVFFILGLRGLSGPEKARAGMAQAAFGMLLAIIGTLLNLQIVRFEWIIADDWQQSVLAWLRKGRDASARCLVVVNFTPEVRRDYRVKVPFNCNWRETLNTDAKSTQPMTAMGIIVVSPVKRTLPQLL